ncbi:Vesicle-associated protein 1-1 [Hibiscus syriacus]|uniref:Vesicle-associated protein 1-1 n=1 Tax=Hibiscus syriacus TaxID=106335 RepID=A0A6A2ZF95_HIBSY|nr:Vesicle-associated protein 1-1 [Hibiscus syriacus]KAE8690209.1 Vesicle-associated protein 1-1 [Hibiscus syriacus]KAE8690210.1 Vesicle-associated protein 1-1 [Hibiscus syriacus]
MTAGDANQLISVQPNDLKFICELDKPILCNLQVMNNTDNHVAYKVKTTSPKNFVRPNTGIVMPRDSCIIRVTLQAQSEYPPDMQCKDKFLLQSTIVPPPSRYCKNTGIISTRMVLRRSRSAKLKFSMNLPRVKQIQKTEDLRASHHNPLMQTRPYDTLRMKGMLQFGKHCSCSSANIEAATRPGFSEEAKETQERLQLLLHVRILCGTDRNNGRFSVKSFLGVTIDGMNIHSV